MNLPRNLPALLRVAGLEVIEVDGWETRGRPASTGGFAPVGVLNHHTGASAKLWSRTKRLAYAKWMALTGRPADGLPAPLTGLSLGPDGEVYLLAAGRANHAGTAKASGSVAGGDGNTLYIGIEWMLSGTESIPAKMMAAGATLNAVLTEHVTDGGKGTSVETISCHYNTSVTGKWDIGDPNGVPYGNARVLDVPKFRRAVAAERRRLYHVPAQTPTPPTPPVHPVPPRKNTMSVAVVNVPIKVGEVAWQECWLLAAESPVFGLNESFTKAQRDLYKDLADEHGFGHWGLVNSGNPVFWKRSEFSFVSGRVHKIHGAAPGLLAKKYPGFNGERTLNEVVLKRRSGGREAALLNLHLVPNGNKVNPIWRAAMRVKSKRLIRSLAQAHREAGRIVIVEGDTNMAAPFSLGDGMRWLRGQGIDKIGSNCPGTATTFEAPTDHKHGIRATIKV